jgi:hypothetical protein
MVRNLIPFLALLAAPIFAGEGVIVLQQHEDLQRGAVSNQKMYIEQDKVAIESDGPEGRTGFVYLAGPGLLRIIDHKSQSYREMTEQEIEQLMGGVQEQFSQVQKQMAEQMKNMTPEQRAMMEKMMGGRMAKMGGMPGAVQVEKTTYRRGDGSTEIGGRSCDWYEGFKSEKLVSLVCATDYSTFDLRPSDFTVFQRLASFIAKLAPQMADQIKFGSEDWESNGGFPGVPLEQKSFQDGRPVDVSTLKSVERGQLIDGAAYEAPAGYKKQKGLR